MKVKATDDGAYLFECPGCECMHMVYVDRANRPVWSFNGDKDAPTFSPSILVTSSWMDKPTICHSFVRDGKIEFLSDCTHKLKGQTVGIPDWED